MGRVLGIRLQENELRPPLAVVLSTLLLLPVLLQLARPMGCRPIAGGDGAGGEGNNEDDDRNDNEDEMELVGMLAAAAGDQQVAEPAAPSPTGSGHWIYMPEGEELAAMVERVERRSGPLGRLNGTGGEQVVPLPAAKAATSFATGNGQRTAQAAGRGRQMPGSDEQPYCLGNSIAKSSFAWGCSNFPVVPDDLEPPPASL